MSINLHLPILLVSNNSSGELLDFLNINAQKLRHTTSLRTALSVLDNYPAKIVVADLPLEESRKLVQVLEAKDILSLVFTPNGTSIKEIENIHASSWISYPFKSKFLEETLLRLQRQILYTQTLHDSSFLASQLENAFDSSTIISKTDPRGIITYANHSFEEISGYSKDELIGKPHNIVRHPDMPKSTFAQMWDTIKQGQIWKGIIKNRRKDGSTYIVESTIVPILSSDGKPLEYMGIRHDITPMATQNLYLKDVAHKNEELAKAKSNALLEKLYKDEVTNLPNSLALQNDIVSFENGTLYLLDINNFNIYNKLYGFAFGDALIREISKNFLFLFGSNDRLYKLSADRYALLTYDYDTDTIENTCNQVFAYFDNTDILVDGIEVLISFSIGVAQVKAKHDSIVDAEFALDLSKKHGKRFKVVYDSNSNKIREELESIAWLNKTRDFIYRDLIVPYYQPIVDVKTREIYKYECLARVVDGDVVIPPLLFLGAAGRLGLLTSVTKSMINKSFEYFSDKDIKFSINITERDIMDGYLVEFIKLKAERHGINPRNVTFEVLENLTLSKDGDLVNSTISLVKDYGCDIAIDDFGSENSNFSRLLSLQSDYIKIDGAFVRDCDVDLEKQKIIDAIVQLTKRLGIKSIAEFVSTEAIFETVKRLGVDYAQGYLFGKPEPDTL